METITTAQSDLTPAPDATAGVLLIVNTDDETPTLAVFEYAIAVAQRDQVALTIYDRSEETWGDSQHPEGPMQLDDDRLDDRPALRGLLQLAAAKDVEVQGWVSTLPSVSAVTSALSTVGASIAIIPDNLSRRLLERALAGESLGDSLATQIGRNPAIDAAVVVVAEDGERTLAEASK